MSIGMRFTWVGTQLLFFCKEHILPTIILLILTTTVVE